MMQEPNPKVNADAVIGAGQPGTLRAMSALATVNPNRSCTSPRHDHALSALAPGKLICAALEAFVSCQGVTNSLDGTPCSQARARTRAGAEARTFTWRWSRTTDAPPPAGVGTVANAEGAYASAPPAASPHDPKNLRLLSLSMDPL
jgi:hypothetical protein